MRSNLIIALLLLTVTNVIIYFNRTDFTFTAQQSYRQLYPEVNRIAVDKVIKTGNGSTLQFHIRNAQKNVVSWVSSADSSTHNFQAFHPVLQLKAGAHEYFLSGAAYQDSIFAGIDFLPAKNKTDCSIIVVYHSNIANLLPSEIDGFKALSEDISQEELSAVQKTLRDSMQLPDNGTTVEKVNAIAGFLHARIFGSAGTPEAAVIRLNPYQQYVAATRGQKIWCGIYTGIFKMFGNAAGIRNRIVEIKYGYAGLEVNSHVFNEYFDEDLKKWCAIDVMFNNTRYVNAEGTVLNGMDIKNTDKNDSSVKAVQFAGDSLVNSAFTSLPTEFHNLYVRNKDAYFYIRPVPVNESAWSRFKNYMLSS